jgi:hypothetical protein
MHRRKALYNAAASRAGGSCSCRTVFFRWCVPALHFVCCFSSCGPVQKLHTHRFTPSSFLTKSAPRARQ